MAVETKFDLREETVKKLQKLIRYNIDSYDGFRESAEEIDDEKLSRLFREIAQERSEMASELQNYVEWNGEDAEDDGSVMAAMHRAWINVRSKLSSGPHAVLSEAERGEDYIKDAYEDTLQDQPGTAMNDVLQKQYARVKAAHDRIRDLRDCYADDSDSCQS